MGQRYRIIPIHPIHPIHPIIPIQATIAKATRPLKT